MQATLKYYNGTETNKNGMKQGWDDLMQQYQCCGINSTSDDFSQSGWRLVSGQQFPPACCLNKPDICQASSKFQDVKLLNFKSLILRKVKISFRDATKN